jgi:hypothetical protein
MLVDFDMFGRLTITAENNVESYALAAWGVKKGKIGIISTVMSGSDANDNKVVLYLDHDGGTHDDNA